MKQNDNEALTHFNSIKVRLNLIILLQMLLLLNWFQFHKGTIKPSFGFMFPKLGRKFQFHKGTIKPGCWTLLWVVRRQFQFHKGTIKPKGEGRQGFPLHPFQFHKGTIKPVSFWIFLECFQWYFNSIKVRLNQPYLLRPSAADTNFNSIKVRLNPEAVEGIILVKLFQFHKGTIKPLWCQHHTAALHTFQFHKGTIKPDFDCKDQFVDYKFQFHKGTIKPCS